jgi:hypothetical protein
MARPSSISRLPTVPKPLSLLNCCNGGTGEIKLNRIEAALHVGQNVVGAVLPLAELRTVHEMMEGMRSRPRGKIVLKTG